MYLQRVTITADLTRERAVATTSRAISGGGVYAFGGLTIDRRVPSTGNAANWGGGIYTAR